MKLIGQHIENGGWVDAEVRHVNSDDESVWGSHRFDGTVYDVMTVTLS